MGLREYVAKRKFGKTPEPRAKKSVSKKGRLRFVIQKHAASHLHYDFRLEMDGVLKSWAVPKGPSINPKDKRLAMMVEDHPMDYRTFEGIIPPGNYGAGTVMVWDEGYYYFPDEEDDVKASEKKLLSGLKKGHVTFILEGSKLHGEFALIKIRSKNYSKDNSWLLVKADDEYALKDDISKLDRSIVTNRTLDEIADEAESKGTVWQSNRLSSSEKKAISKTKKPAAKKSLSKKEKPVIKGLDKIKKSAMPHNLKPMLATLVDEPFNDDDWVFEVKWDGFRAIAEVEKNKVEVYSRNNLSFNHRFPAIVNALKEYNFQAVLDGEVVVVDNEGRSKFQLIQNYQRTGAGTLMFYVFDILFLDGHDLTHLSLTRRKEILKNILPDSEYVKYSDHIPEDGISLFEACQNVGLEGVIAKKASSVYKVGARTKDWLKIKAKMQQEAVIAGFTEGKGSRKHFGALILGVHENDELVYIGHTGGGFDEKKLVNVIQKLKPLIRKTSPFKIAPKTKTKVTWVKPQLVCEVTFQEWTDSGQMRIPIFLGLREDKQAHEVVREKPAHVTQSGVVMKSHKENPSSQLKVVHSKRKEEEGNKKVKSVDLIDLKNGEEQIVKIEKHNLKLTNLSKLYWKKEKITKLDLINYYIQIAPYILPYLKDRPESLHRYPNGVSGKSFFQKDVAGMPPEWIKTEMIYSGSNDRDINYLLCQNKATLVYLANLGCIELNPWHSRIGSLENPDYIIIDLDPLEVSFDKVIEVAQVTYEVLSEAGIKSYCKTSGSSGLHVYIPLNAKYDYDQAKSFAEIIANLVHQRLPKTTSVERSTSKRKRKVYLDFLQNRMAQTIAAPYCVRPRPGASVSTPLLWEEVQKGISPQDFTIYNILDRITKHGDIFKPVLGKGINIESLIDKLTHL